MSGSLWTSIGLMYAILIGVNIPASLLGIEFPNNSDRERLWYEPPGYVIPLAWFILFAMLGIARFELLKTQVGSLSSGWLIGLAVLCAGYAYYTIGLSQLTGVSALWFGLVGNVIVIAFALFVAHLLMPKSVTASLLVLPVALWTAYATAIVIGQMKAQQLL